MGLRGSSCLVYKRLRQELQKLAQNKVTVSDEMEKMVGRHRRRPRSQERRGRDPREFSTPTVHPPERDLDSGGTPWDLVRGNGGREPNVPPADRYGSDFVVGTVPTSHRRE